MTYDALIIGAGPAGATTALLLAQAGLKVALVEKKTFPRRKVCGEFISATSLPLLHKLGIADLYLTNGGPEVKRVGLFASETSLISAMPQIYQSSNKWGRAYGREHLDAALLKMATVAGAKLWQPCVTQNIQRHATHFTCDIVSKEKKEEINTRIIIMANGSWERCTEMVCRNENKSTDLLAFKAHFVNSALDTDLMPLLAFPGGYGGMAHTDGGRVTLSCCIRRDVLQMTRKTYPGLLAGEAVLQHIINTCAGARTALENAKLEGKWLAAGPIQPGIRKRYADGIFFVGNIAGEAHPVIAEGISMAMQSAWVLAQILIAKKSRLLNPEGVIAAGKDYEKQWRKHFASRIYAASIFAQFAMRPWAMAALLPIIKIFPQLITFGAKLSGKIKLVV